MQVGKISPYDLQKTFPSFYSEMNGTTGSGYFYYCPRILHNQEQVIRCQLRDGSTSPNASIKYWNMDGSAAAQFTINSAGAPYKNILDIYWINDEMKYVYVTMDPSVVSPSTYSIYKCASDGSTPQLLVNNITDDQYAAWSTASSGGYVGITASNSDIFLKMGANLYKIREGLAGDWSVVSAGATKVTNAFHYGSGFGCQNLMFQPGTSTSGHILYTWYDSNIDVLYLRSIDAPTMTYEPSHWAMLNFSDYNQVREPVFINQLDTSSLHCLKVTSYSGVASTGTTLYKTKDTGAYFNVFNIDESLAAFLNVNSSDTVMPAGIGATADIIANVINCWGTTLSGKLVQFWVSSGDGGVYPSWDYTDSSGKAYTVFTTGNNVGTSNIAVVVNET